MYAKVTKAIHTFISLGNKKHKLFKIRYMDWWDGSVGKALTSKPDYLSLIPRITHTVGRESHLSQVVLWPTLTLWCTCVQKCAHEVVRACTHAYTHKLKVIKIFLETNTCANGKQWWNHILEVSLYCVYYALISKNIKVESTILKDNHCSVEMSPQLQDFSKTMKYK